MPPLSLAGSTLRLNQKTKHVLGRLAHTSDRYLSDSLPLSTYPLPHSPGKLARLDARQPVLVIGSFKVPKHTLVCSVSSMGFRFQPKGSIIFSLSHSSSSSFLFASLSSFVFRPPFTTSLANPSAVFLLDFQPLAVIQSLHTSTAPLPASFRVPDLFDQRRRPTLSCLLCRYLDSLDCVQYRVTYTCLLQLSAVRTWR